MRQRARGRAVGWVLLAAGLAWLIADRLLRAYLPLVWDGPNMGGGALVLLALGAVGAGAVLVVRGVSRQHRAAEGHRLDVVSGVGLAVTGLLAVALVVVLVVRPSDPAAGLNGQVGVTVSATTGAPVLVVETCRGRTDTVTIVGPHREGATNEVLARYDATPAAAATSTVLLDVLHPPAGWSAQPDERRSVVDAGDLRIASGRGPRSALRQVDFTRSDLVGLDEGTVLYSDPQGRHRASRSAFRALACR